MKISSVLKRFIYGLTISICALLFIINIMFINNLDKTEWTCIEGYQLLYLEASILIMMGIIGFGIIANKIRINKIVNKLFIILLFAVYLFVQIKWIDKINVIPYADSEDIMVASDCLTNDKELYEHCNGYLSYYPQQITLSVVFTAIFKVCGRVDYKIIQYLNAISNTIAMIGLYFIMKELSKQFKINKAVFLILSLTFLPVILLSTFVYGDFIGMMFAIWAIFFAIKHNESEKKILFMALSGIFLAIACLVRMNYIIIAIAVVLYWAICFLQDKDISIKKTIVKIAMIIVFVLIIFVPGKIIKSTFIEKYNLNKDGAFSTVPYLYMGMSEGDRGYGWFNGDVGIRVFGIIDKTIDDVDETNRGIKEDFNNRVIYMVKHPAYAAKFYLKKIISMWAEPTMEVFFYSNYHKTGEQGEFANNFEEGSYVEYIRIYQKALCLLILFGTTVSLIVNFKNKNSSMLLLALTFLGGFAFHILWEAKSRYIIPYYIVLIPVASIGLTKVIDKFESFCKRIRLDKGE